MVGAFGIVVLTLVMLNSIISAYGQSPCPSIYHLVNSDVAGERMGRIEIPNPPKNMALHIKVDMSVAAVFRANYAGDLDLATSKDAAALAVQQGRPLLYNLRFPIQNPIPSITAITFNGRRYCTGSAATGSSVTSISLEHTFSSSGNSLSSNFPATTIDHFSNNRHITDVDDYFKNDDFFKDRPSTNTHNFFKNRPSTDTNDFFKNHPSMNTDDFFKNRPSTDTNDFFKNRPSTDTNDFLKNHPSMNTDDFFSNPYSTNFTDFPFNRPASKIKEFSFHLPSGITDFMNPTIGSNIVPIVKPITTVPGSIRLQRPTERPRPVITTQRPRPVIRTVRPLPVVTTVRPPPVITTVRPPPVITTARPPPVITTVRPPPVVTTERPQPIISAARPQPIISAVRPQPIISTARPQPIISAVRPQPIISAVRPQPIISAVRPQPIISTARPQPIISAVRPQPIISTARPQPVLPAAAPTVNPQNPFLNPPPVNVEQNCGRPGTINHLIANGETTMPGQWPWIAAIFIARMEYEFLCGGSLITDRHVITAAHCKVTDDGEMPASAFLVALGRYHLMEWREEGSMTSEVLDFRTHPGYLTKNSADSDLALIILRERVEFTPKIQPLCLWSRPISLENVVGLRGYVVGWGTDENGNLHLHEPRLAQSAIVSQAACRQSHLAFTQSTSNRTFCAGYRDGSGPCNGDSGSGFVVQDSITGRFYLRGVVSLSPSNGDKATCDLSQYVVYVDAAQYLDWIRIQIIYN